MLEEINMLKEKFFDIEIKDAYWPKDKTTTNKFI